MSLLKWKEMAEKRSELGKNINTVKETIKKIADTMGDIQAENLFKPITSGLKDIARPQIPIRRIPTKKRPVPDYGLEIGDDENLDQFDLDNLFGEEVQPQKDKQVVPKPPAYDDVLKDLETGEKQMYIDPEYMSQNEDLPPEYEEDETIDYNILEEDRINQILDPLGIANYDDIESQLNQQDMSKKKQSFLSKKNQAAVVQIQTLPGYKTNVVKQLRKGEISNAEAQYRIKIIDDTRKVLTDYIKFNQTRLANIKGSGLKRNKKRGGKIMFFNDPSEMRKKLELIIVSRTAGNNSKNLRNNGVAILDILKRNSIITITIKIYCRVSNKVRFFIYNTCITLTILKQK